ncbi:hypothetical protein [uncultured Mediterranean phage]|nr:hypothetical protein [uncultured Mediterranean phage]
MGIINHDVFANRYGQELTNTYISLGNNSIGIQKNNGKYMLHGSFTIWLSKQIKNKGKNSFNTFTIQKELSSSEITGNIYATLYTELKKIYTNTTDDL